MDMLNRKTFLKGFNQAKRRKKLTTAKIAKRSGISESYAYRLLSKGNHEPKILGATAKKMCRGVGMTAKQTTALLHKSEIVSPEQKKQARFEVPKIVKARMKKIGISTNKLAGKSGLNDRRLKSFLDSGSHFSKISLIKLSVGLGLKPKALLSHYIPTSSTQTVTIPNKTHGIDLKPKSPKKTSKTSSRKKKAPTAHKAIDTFNTSHNNKKNHERPAKKPNGSNNSSELKPEVMDLARLINNRYVSKKLSSTGLAVLRLLVERLH